MEPISKSSFNWRVYLLLLALTLTVQLTCSAPRNRTMSSSYSGRSSSKTGRSKGRTHPSGVAIKQKSPCSALIDGRLIDLTPLGDTSFKPGYAVEVGGWTYSFNPCFPFNVPENPYTGLQDQCDFVAMCQSKETSEGHVAYTMGIQRTTSFILHPPPGANQPEVTSRPPEMTSQGDADLWIDSDPKIDVDPLHKDSEGSSEDSEEEQKGEEKEEREEDDEEESEKEEGESEQGVSVGKEEGVESEHVETGNVQKSGEGLEKGHEVEGIEDEEEEGSGQNEDEEEDDDDDDDEDDGGNDNNEDDNDEEEEEEEDELGVPTPKTVRSGSQRQRRVKSLRDRRDREIIRDKREIKDRSRQRNQRRRARKRKTPILSPILSQDNSSLVEMDEDELDGAFIDPATNPEGVTQTLSDELTTQRSQSDTSGGNGRTKTKKSKKKKVPTATLR